MGSYLSMSKEQLEQQLSVERKNYEAFKAKNLSLDMSRGKPCKQQLDLCEDMYKIDFSDGFNDAKGVDCRNYGILEGIPETRELFADILGTKPQNVFVGGNASLNLMYEVMSIGFIKGMKDSETPWGKLDKVKVLCPSPGYDRHFSVSGHFGFEPVVVPMTENGPDMDFVEQLVLKDDSIKAIWCVPVFSNPDGIVYSDETVERLASMKTAAKDFTIMWDNAYVVHSIYGDAPKIPEIISLCEKHGNKNRVYEFTSTSKITAAGAGISALASSEENIAHFVATMKFATIGYDKVNQLRHAKYLKNKDGVLSIMKKHADILRPKFEAVISMLEKEIKPLGIAEWINPKGGYFVSFFAMEGTAKRIGELCKQAGVVMTPAGATYPDGNDPKNSNLRIAPSFPPVSELITACELFCVATKIASLEKLLETK